MDQPVEQRPGTASSAAVPAPRRALRKGTHSCGECKRRKTRCFFETPGAAKCVGCQRRASECISQEYVDVPAHDGRQESSVAESLGQMQQMLEQIMRKTGVDEQPGAAVGAQPLAAVDRPSSSCEPEPASDSDGLGGPKQKQPGQPHLQQQQQQLPPPPPLRSAGVPPRLASTCQTLHAAFPPQADVKVLFAAGRAAIYVQALCNPYHELFAEGNVRSLEAVSDLPAATAHPVLLARKLLHLALCLQQLDPGFDAGALRLGRPVREAMWHYFDLASAEVTCHDALLDSLEGLECLICEAVYLVNSGSLRRALLTLRRALTLAQFMGFHALPAPWALRQLDPATRVSSTVTWDHLAWLERFVSLLLGLPTSITGGRTAPPQRPDAETPSEWMEKVQVDMCARIQRRNQDRDTCFDYAATQRIDGELNAIAESLPPDWWSPLDFPAGIAIEGMMERMISAQIQMVHFTLIALLHLPYLLRRPAAADAHGITSSQLSYSKSACTFACREVLARFVPFRAFVRVVFCCRPVDFCALTAALVLLVAHLSGQRHADSGWLLPHHRCGDRTLIGKAIDTMAELNRLNDDELSRQTAALAQRLLDLEARNTKDRLPYSATAAPDTLVGLVADDEDSLLLQIPYFGAVRLACEPTSPSFPPSGPITSSSTPSHGKESSYVASTMAYADMSSSSLGHGSVFVPNMSSHVSTVQDFHAMTSYGQSYLPMQLEQPLPFMYYDPMVPTPQSEGDLFSYDVAMPDLMTGTDGWAFQGVDATVFDNLIRGGGYPHHYP